MGLREQLETHLRSLIRQGLISEWHNLKILPGATWVQEIDAYLEAASIVLLLVSPDFLASDYCYEIEMKRALERHKQGATCVIPILSCDLATGSKFLLHIFSTCRRETDRSSTG